MTNSFSLLILVFGSVSTFVIALVAIKKNLYSQTNQLFALLAVSMIGWSVTTHLSLQPHTGYQLELIRFSMLFVILMNTAFLYLLSVFPNTSIRWGKWHYIGVFYAMFAMFVAISPWMFTGLSVSSQGEISPSPGPGIIVFLLHAIVFIGVSLRVLFKKFKKSKGFERAQLRYVVLGLSLFITLTPLTNFILPVLLKQSSLVALSPLNSAVFALALGYAIIFHRLLDVRMVIVRSLTYSLTVIILLVVYIIIIYGVGLAINRGEPTRADLILNGLLAIFVAVTYQPLKTKLEKVTNRVFYKSDYDSNELIASVTTVMAETLKLDELTQLSLKQITETINITYGSFWVLNGDEFICAAIVGDRRDNSKKPSQEQLRALAGSDHVMVLEDDVDSQHRQLLRAADASVAVPLQASNNLQGILLLGEKQSGEVYASKDLSVLRILAPGLATALDNARSYKQISEFNVTLKHEVEKATKDLQVANEKLSKNNEKLKHLDELKDEFISVTSHELRTPLTSIKGYLWMAMHGKKRDDKYIDYMTRAYASTERLIAMVNDTLDVSRIESGRVALSIEPVNLNKLAQEVVDDLKDRAVEHHQDLVLKKTRALPLVDCDPTKIYQVFTNLVSNALKFTPPGGKIKIDFTHRGSEVIVRVQDNGPGIIKSDQDKLFQKFSRLETTIPGTGLGLYLCLQIIRLSKGRIWIESQEGRGATFLFTLPVSKTQNAKILKHPQQFRNIA